MCKDCLKLRPENHMPLWIIKRFCWFGLEFANLIEKDELSHLFCYLIRMNPLWELYKLMGGGSIFLAMERNFDLESDSYKSHYPPPPRMAVMLMSVYQLLA